MSTSSGLKQLAGLAGVAGGAAAGGPIGAGLAAVGSGLFGSGSQEASAEENYKYNKKLLEQQQEYYKQNQQRAFELSQINAQNAAVNQVQGFKAAGLNPAAAVGNSMTPAAIPSASAPSAGASQGQAITLDSASALLAMEQAKLVASQKTSVDLENNNKETMNAAIDDSIKSWAAEVASDPNASEAQKMWAEKVNALAEGGATFNKGNLDALKAYYDIRIGEAHEISELKRERYEAALYHYMIANKAYLWGSKVPENTIKKMAAEMTNLYSSAALLEVQKDLTGEEINNVKTSVKKALVEIGKIQAETKAIHHGDNVALFENNEWANLGFKAVSFVGEKAVDAAAGAASMYAGGRGLKNLPAKFQNMQPISSPNGNARFEDTSFPSIIGRHSHISERDKGSYRALQERYGTKTANEWFDYYLTRRKKGESLLDFTNRKLK